MALLENSARDGSAARLGQGAWFTTTHWSVVLAAGHHSSAGAQAALEELCQTYWYPLYAFVRRLGHSPHDAEDLVQTFFARCLEKNYLATADAAKGRFRSFLLVMLKRFLAHESDKVRTRKRGKGRPPVELDALTVEQRYAMEPADLLSADRLFERRWALTLLEKVLDRLRDELSECRHQCDGLGVDTGAHADHA